MELTMKERKIFTKALCERYRKAGKKEKGAILDTLVEATGYNRCYARNILRNHGRTVLLNPKVKLEGDARKTPRRPKPRTYDQEFLKPLTRIWEIMDYIGSKRLAAAMPEILPRLVAFKEIRVKATIRDKLLAISPATMDRLLKPVREKQTIKGRCHTKPGTLLKHQIPIRTFSEWDDTHPGFLEMDLVAHDGGSARGEYCFTLDMTDIQSGWTEQAAVINKAQTHVFQGIQAIRERLPFSIAGLHSDNGAEFINHHMQRYCEQERITFTRGRPYRKNDTCHIEQKNWSIVRRFAGYARFESQTALDLLNEMYELLRDYNNFFMPSMRLKEKIRDGAHVAKRYHKPKTPYAMLMESPHLDNTAKERLKQRYENLNPAGLKRKIDAVQNRLVKMSVRVPAQEQQPDKAEK